MPVAAFDEVRSWWAQSLLAEHSQTDDAYSGEKLDVLAGCVAVEIQGDPQEQIKDYASLAAWLHSEHGRRCAGGTITRPACALVTAGPSSGKTFLISQVIRCSVDGELVPILLKGQLLQAWLHSNPHAFETAWNWIDAYLRLEHLESEPALYRMLRQAMIARRALLLIDGLDEGGSIREELERHVAEVLAPQGHVLLATSRPDDEPERMEERFAAFKCLSLLPLSEAKQQSALEKRLGVESAGDLLSYLKDKGLSGRITTNPLMLSVVVGVHGIREGIGMPENENGIYDVATDTVLNRIRSASLAGDVQLEEESKGEEIFAANQSTVNETLQAMSAICWTVHVKEQRVVTSDDLRHVALRIGDRPVRALIEAVLDKGLPLLNLLQMGPRPAGSMPQFEQFLASLGPLQLQASHLSFQEYMVARAIHAAGSASGTPAHVQVLSTPPWCVLMPPALSVRSLDAQLTPQSSPLLSGSGRLGGPIP